MSDDKTLRGDEAIKLWLQGREKWNEWVVAHPDWSVDFTDRDFSKYRDYSKIEEKIWPFAGFNFPNGSIDFDDATFRGGGKDENVTFFGASFGNGRTYFNRVDFGGGHVDFRNIIFNGTVRFNNLKNERELKSFSFNSSVFKSSFVLSSHQEFGCLVDLTGTNMSSHVSLAGLKCNPKPKGKVENELDSERARRLKELAVNNKHYSQVLDFHALEMKAARDYKYNIWTRLGAEYLYDKLSDYGRSIWRPVVGLGAVWAVFSFLYCWSSNNMMGGFWDKVVASGTFSMAQMLAFVPSARDARKTSMDTLFCDKSLLFDLLPFQTIFVVTFTQSVLAIILLFLLGLGFRNKFRV